MGPTIIQICGFRYRRHYLHSLGTVQKYTIQPICIYHQAENLCELSNSFNSKFSGPVVRSSEYVVSWIGSQTSGEVTSVLDNQTNRPVAYTIIGDYFKPILQVKDLAIADEFLEGNISISLVEIFIWLIKQETHRLQVDITSNGIESLQIRLPHPILEVLLASDLTNYAKDIQILPNSLVDNGWMCLSLDNCRNGKVDMDSDIDTTVSNNISKRVYWPVDNF